MLLSQRVPPETKGGASFTPPTPRRAADASRQARRRTTTRQAAEALTEMIEMAPPLPPGHVRPCPSP